MKYRIYNIGNVIFLLAVQTIISDLPSVASQKQDVADRGRTAN